ncbi:MdtA/MuxA family multidrug efflux RND transporter periplasmic adaptor subunit [Thauera sinica]|uniref:MdtA/MuxA family multidrug efflux RND transporter periplasmic adaptor subunit n=1 Tax=Thauera sinica TaxID=2665146 RepID=A0ABW1AMH2_9RHOO|nr:MdtA/MuxA family multidrug efflux RND transporter periplasmic adaptor subunit [Thauera sp. K11]
MSIRKRKHFILWPLAVLAAAGAWWLWQGRGSPAQAAPAPEAARAGQNGVGGRDAPPGAGGQSGAGREVPVAALPVRKASVRVVQTGPGSVAPLGQVTVRARVDGQLVRVLFDEGQDVRAGALLAEIDPRPYRAQLAQVEGQAQRNRALLDNARLDLERYRTLLDQQSIARQLVDAQASLVRQYEGTVRADQGLVDQARLQLEFTRITAPISGRIGLRQVDAGNNISPSDSGGLAVITERDPISVVFALPENLLPQVAQRFEVGRRAGRPLPVEAWDRGGRRLLGRGELRSIDNQIDQATGTVRLKAVFANPDGGLFPNQFVNVHLLVETRDAAVVVPGAAVQRGNRGAFVYVVGEDRTVAVRPVSLGPVDGEDVVVEQGLEPGELVVVSGVDRLRAGARVALAEAAKPGNGDGPGGNGRGPAPGRS